MKVTFITTVGHNIGDDFVRLGLQYLLERGAGRAEYALVHKHFPVTARDRWRDVHQRRWMRLLRRIKGFRTDRLSRWLDAGPLTPGSDAVLDCDLLVQAGAPVYWLNERQGSESAEWYQPLISRRWSRRQPRPPLLNLGAGTCQPFDSDGSEFARSPATLAHAARFFDECAVTTVRDRLSQEVLRQAGREAKLLLCPSLLAARHFAVRPKQPEYVVLNFMPQGGHYTFGEDVAGRWRAAFAGIVARISAEERCLLVCHDRREFECAHRWFPAVPRFLGTKPADYFEVYSRASYGIVNRVHGAFALASLGRPSVVIGSDSRARMVRLLRLPVLEVAAVDQSVIFQAREEVRALGANYAAWMADVVDRLEEDYLHLLGPVTERVRDDAR